MRKFDWDQGIQVVANLGYDKRVRAVWHRPHLNFGMPLAWPVFKERANPRFVTWMEQNVIPADT